MDISSRDALQNRLAILHREAEEREAERIARQNKLPYVNLDKTAITIEAVKLLSESEARGAFVVAIELKVHEVALAVADPTLPQVQHVIEALAAHKYLVKVFVSSRRGIEQAWRFYRFVTPEAQKITGKITIEEKQLQSLTARLTSFGAVTEEIKKFDFSTLSTTEILLDIVLAGALANHASDVHFEAEEKDARIRFRLDGLLHDVFTNLPLRNYASIISRIKLLSELKLNVRDEAQDGRFTINLSRREVEVRISIIPAEFGETIVMRLLDPNALKTNLIDLGLRADDLALVENQLARPNGLLLNTGPTGSGKTTTLYTFLRRINEPEIKIITIEDPIEYRLPGVDQTQVNPEAHYTFASGLRSIVRQDPDVILVGEIRDLETAEIAMQSALTGHLVFSTLHTNDAIGAVPRLLELGIKPMIIGPSLNLVIAQRLVRILCKDCKRPAELSLGLETKLKNFLEKLPQRVDRGAYKNPTIFEPVGCDKCNHFGYKGRVGVFEFFEAGPEFQELLLKEVSETGLFALARKQGMVTMQEDGVLKAISGVTTLAEVEDITGKIEW